MQPTTSNRSNWLDSLVVTGIALAILYWVCESFMFFFMSPEANFFHHIFGPDLFEVWNRLLVLCLFAIFVSHVQYNIKNRQMADEKLRQQDEKYRVIMENIDEGFFETDLSGRLTFFNHSVNRFLGCSAEELLNDHYRKYTSPEGARKIEQGIESVSATGKPAHIHDIEIIRSDGSRGMAEVSVYLIKNKKEQPVGFRGVARDVSGKYAAEKEKKRMEMQLLQAQKMEAIGNLAGGIAHDFNNILMGMQGNASLMMVKLDDSDPFYEKVKSIERHIESGAALTRQLLGFARGGKYEVRVTDLNDLIVRTARMFGRTKKEIQIHTRGLRAVRAVEADPTQIEQVLMNLFINAWHAMPGGGDIYLESLDVDIDEKIVKPFHVEPGPYVCFSVKDTGVGIDPHIQNRIFEPFFTTKEMGRGTGLGLASVYGIIKNHGGFIEVHSHPGQGATFSLHLPATIKRPRRERTTAEMLKTGTETILFVDDEPNIVEIGEEVLQSLGYKTLTANSGEQALRIFREKKDEIDLVMLDLVMPELGGGETFEALRTIDPSVRVLLCSGYSLNGQAREILQRGCDGFIQKPFKLRQLADELRGILDRPN
ncbi:MAG TPA: ATP-binding protein [Desulfobacterales bacterium]